MQHNAPCYNANSIMAFLASKNVEMIQWPPYSPDLNPIENLWGLMKRKLADDYPVCTSHEQLETSFLAIWDSITPDVCQHDSRQF
jgi:transposase